MELIHRVDAVVSFNRDAEGLAKLIRESRPFLTSITKAKTAKVGGLGVFDFRVCFISDARTTSSHTAGSIQLHPELHSSPGRNLQRVDRMGRGRKTYLSPAVPGDKTCRVVSLPVSLLSFQFTNS